MRGDWDEQEEDLGALSAFVAVVIIACWYAVTRTYWAVKRWNS